MSRDIMTAKELAEYLSIAESTVYKKVEYREIPFTKVGSLLRFPKWLIDQWLTEKAVRPDDTLFDEFIRLSQRYHLKQFLKAKGLDIDGLNETQLVEQLTRAVSDLKSSRDDHAE